MRHWDIKIVVLIGLGAAAVGLFILMEGFALNNVPEENVVYIDTMVGGIDDDPEAEEIPEAEATLDEEQEAPLE